MDFLKVIEKLNNLDCDKIAQFYYAKTVDNIAKLVSNVAPCAKLAVFTMQKSAILNTIRFSFFHLQEKLK